ncbi:MAG: N-acetylmuramoyl-L-alanine amidase [Candidatus Omnitrophota bacterium]
MRKNIILFFLVIILLSGCASVPMRDALPIYALHGTSYMPLKSFCDLRGISWEYDTFARTVNIAKDEHKIDLMVGNSLVLVDGNPVHLKYPIDFYQGVVVVPVKFKEQLDTIFLGTPATQQKTHLVLQGIRKIVVDAGHGGDDPGAIGRTGLREKDVNLDIAKRLTKLLKAEGAQVMMTRSSDNFISLQGRVDTANKFGADIFLSIHSNANRVKSLNGFEVYYVAPSVDDPKRAIVAAREANLDFDRSCFDRPTVELKAILWDMIYSSSRQESISLARSICRTMDRNTDTRILGVKGARYFVLKGTRMPAILIEVGFLSNINEEKMLKNSYYRQQLAEGILDGVNNYSQNLSLVEAR